MVWVKHPLTSFDHMVGAYQMDSIRGFTAFVRPKIFVFQGLEEPKLASLAKICTFLDQKHPTLRKTTIF